MSVPPASSQGRAVVSWAQRRALALGVGTLVAELESCLQRHHSSSEKELRALDNQILHLATILKVLAGRRPQTHQTYVIHITS